MNTDLPSSVGPDLRAGFMLLKLFACHALATATVIGSGCATAPQAGPDHGQLDIANLAPAPIDVVFAGRVETVVPPGQRRVLRFIPAGLRTFRFTSIDGHSEAVELAVPAGGTVNWNHVPQTGDPLPVPPPLSRLTVRNTLSVRVLVRLDGDSAGFVLPQDNRVFEGIPAGAVLAEAEPDDGGSPVIGRLELAPENANTWEIRLEGREVAVRNTTQEAIFVSVDGQMRGRIAAGESRTFTETARLHSFSAISEPSRRRYERDFDLRSEDSEKTWEIAQGNATIQVLNRTDETLTVSHAGRTFDPVAPGGSVQIDGLDSGLLAFVAVDTKGRTFSTTRSIDAADRLEWVVTAPLGSLRVENTTTSPLEIFGGPAGKPTRTLGRIGAEDASEINRLEPGAWVFEAFDIIGGQRFVTSVELGQVGTATWQIRGETGAVRVTNRRREKVVINVDGGEVAALQANEAIVVTGLGPGPHVIGATGQVSRSLQQQRVILGIEEPVDVVFGDSVGTVGVTNETGETLLTLGPIAEQATTLGDGASNDFILAPGTARLSFMGRDSGVAFETVVEVIAGTTTKTILKRERSTLMLTNRLGETVAVTRDGSVLGTVDDGQVVRFEGLEPGRAEIQAVGLGTGKFRSIRVALQPGRATMMLLEPIAATVIIDNRSGENIDIFIDGRLFGNVAAATVRGFGRLAAGDHELVLWHGHSRVELKQTINLAEGEKRLVVAAIPSGTVLVENTSREAISVWVDGKTFADIESDEVSRWLAIPAGSRHIDIDYRNSNHRESLNIEVQAASATHLPVRPRLARLVIINQHDVTLSVSGNDRPIAKVDAASSVMLEDLRAGPVRIVARDDNGRVTHIGLLDLHPGQTATWVMPPMPMP